MSRTEYSYQFEAKVPLLNEEEWQKVMEEHSKDRRSNARRAKLNKYLILLFKRYIRDRRGALDLYEKMTGYHLTDPKSVYCVRLSNFGSLCPNCQKPFRTPRAKICIECLYTLPEGTLAGPLLERED